MTAIPLALGTQYFGTTVSEADSYALLDRFVDAGGTIVDTANSYAFWVQDRGTGGQSERLIGEWLTRRPGVRDRLHLSTKVGADPTVPGDWPGSAEGLSATAVKAAVQASLTRLGTDHVDTYWAHMEDRAVPLEETVGAFAELVAAGTVRQVGCSNHPNWRVEQARLIARTNGWAGYQALQLHHTYLQLRPGYWKHPMVRFGHVTDETLDYAQTEGLALWAYTPLLNGSYTRADRPLGEEFAHEGNTRRLSALDEVAAELGATRNQVVLAWLVGGEPAVTPIIGVSTPAQLDEAIAGVSLTLTEQQRRRLNEAR